jgi:hypothetical protein
MQSTAVEQICHYLATRGFESTTEDMAEIDARIKGHANAQAHRTFEERSKVFTAYRGDLNDFDTTGGFSGERTRMTPALCEGAQDMVMRFAFLEANASKGFTVVYDGNGNFREMFDKNDKDLELYYSLARDVENEDSELRPGLAIESEIVEIQMQRWSQVGKNLALFRAGGFARPGEVRDNCLLFVVEEREPKILWRGRM